MRRHRGDYGARGRGEFNGASKEDGTDLEQRGDACWVCEGVIQDDAVSGTLAGRDIAKIWHDVLGDRGQTSQVLEDHARERAALGRETNQQPPRRTPSDDAGDEPQANSLTVIT